MVVDRSASAPANRRAELVSCTAICRSTHHCADEPSPPARIEHIPSRSITLIGTAPHRAREEAVSRTLIAKASSGEKFLEI